MLTVAVLNSIFTVEASTSTAGCTDGEIGASGGTDDSTGGAGGVEGEAGLSDDDADGVDDCTGGSDADTDGADDGLELAGKELLWLSDGCKSFSLEVQPDNSRTQARMVIIEFLMILTPFPTAIGLSSNLIGNKLDD